MPELTPSTREAARRIGVTDTALRKAVANGRIAREPDGQWDVEKTRRRMVETADPVRSPLAGGGAGGAMSADSTPYARLKVAQLALKVEAQRMALDADKGRTPLRPDRQRRDRRDRRRDARRLVELARPGLRPDCRRSRGRSPSGADRAAAAHHRSVDGGGQSLRSPRHRWASGQLSTSGAVPVRCCGRRRNSPSVNGPTSIGC